jgi:predicted site-specific integrase-resolvase
MPILTRYLTINDLADKMRLSNTSVMRWCRRLRVKPTVNRYNTIRFSESDASRLLERWEKRNKK